MSSASVERPNKGVTELQLDKLQRYAAPVLEAADPIMLVIKAFRVGGYGGGARPVLLTYLAATSRVLSMREGSMPAHLLLVGAPSAGKSYTVRAARRLLPRTAYHIIEAGSSRVLIYENADLRHRALFFGESDSLPTGEDNPGASAIRNLLQDHQLHYKVSVRDAHTGSYQVQHIKKDGPTVLITTSTRRLREQLESRLFCVEVPFSQRQVRAALQMQALLEFRRAPEAPEALIAYQAYLQALAPWDVLVPFADKLADAIGRSPAAARVLRDFARLMSLVKAVAVLRHRHRRINARGQLVATLDDYKLVYELVRDAYITSASGKGERMRATVRAVDVLKKSGKHPRITVTLVAGELGIDKMTASRRIRAAVSGGWLVNDETRPGHPHDLSLGDRLPDEAGLPRPETLGPVTL